MGAENVRQRANRREPLGLPVLFGVWELAMTCETVSPTLPVSSNNGTAPLQSPDTP